ncbi:MAG: hypothetical protein KAR37_02960, partial [Alphaproteobacteria bacterium]|nr:hypothetical protein [Alphaproteobacteria bacterium]
GYGSGDRGCCQQFHLHLKLPFTVQSVPCDGTSFFLRAAWHSTLQPERSQKATPSVWMATTMPARFAQRQQ